MTKHQLLERAMEMCQEDRDTGICIECGTEHDGLEPDARKRHCDACHTDNVYGAEEIIIQLGVA